jgi:hypothetical protein
MSDNGAKNREENRVLIGFGEALAAPEVAWSLLDAGFKVCVFTRNGKRAPIAHCRNIEVVSLVSPEEDAFETVEALIHLVCEGGFSTIMPLDDKSIWACDQVSRRAPVRVVGPTGSLANLALDKRAQLQLASDCRFSVPQTRSIDTAEQLLDIENLPVILKPALAVNLEQQQLVKHSNRVCTEKEQLKTYASQWRQEYPLIAQPVLRGVGEGLFGLSADCRVGNWSAHRRIRMMNPTGSGSSACRSMPIDESLVGPATAMMVKSGWRGLFMLEMLREDTGTAWFMELNGRAWGSMALSRRRGLEYPAWAVKQATDLSFAAPEIVPKDDVTCRHLGREIVHLLIVLHGPKSDSATRWPSRWRTCRDVLSFDNAGYWYNWRSGETRFFLCDTLHTISAAIGRRTGS